MEDAVQPGLARDILNALGANVAAFVLSVVVGAVAGWLIIVFPLGFFGIHCLFVGLYAYLQIRKGRRRRAVLAGCIALLFVIGVGMNLRIA